MTFASNLQEKSNDKCQENNALSGTVDIDAVNQDYTSSKILQGIYR
jgi:predicted RecB family endonuclease